MSRLPAEFSDLEPFVDFWAVATTSGRHARRLESTAEDRERFYEVMADRFDAIFDYLDQWELDEIQGENLTLLRLALATTHVGLAVDIQGAKEEEHSYYARQISISRGVDDI